MLVVLVGIGHFVFNYDLMANGCELFELTP